MYDENSEAAHAAMHGGFDLKNHLKRRQGLGGGQRIKSLGGLHRLLVGTRITTHTR